MILGAIANKKEKENIMQKILITNDDGIQSEGIIRLARAAKKCGTDIQYSATVESALEAAGNFI